MTALPYEKYFEEKRRENHQYIADKRANEKQCRAERQKDIGDFAIEIALGLVCIGLMYFFVGLGGTYR